MALEKCPECNHGVSSTADTCPQCGFNLKKARIKALSTKQKKGCGIGCLTVLVIFFLFRVFSPNDSETGSKSTSTQSKGVQKKTCSAEVGNARLVPFKTADGKKTQAVLVDWKNTGNNIIRSVNADITVYDANGNIIGVSSAKDKCIYACSNSEPGVAPGVTYKADIKNDGFILPPASGVPRARTVKVVITRATSEGF